MHELSCVFLEKKNNISQQIKLATTAYGSIKSVFLCSHSTFFTNRKNIAKRCIFIVKQSLQQFILACRIVRVKLFCIQEKKNRKTICMKNMKIIYMSHYTAITKQMTLSAPNKYLKSKMGLNRKNLHIRTTCYLQNHLCKQCWMFLYWQWKSNSIYR